jgi:5'-methylthioadenosine phosphorylase
MIGVFGGSGFYELLSDARPVEASTPFGSPAAPVTVSSIGSTEVAFMPRHGTDHEFPPHRIPYRANLLAMQSLGVERIIAPTAVGSIYSDFAPGQFVVPDQLVDRTWGRESTFFDGPDTRHIPFADPYCPELRAGAAHAVRTVTGSVHEGGTTVVVQGPRFSTRAESASYAAAGWHLLNMTQLPEAALARELGICYANIAVVTDYDVGVPGDVPPVTHDEVLLRFGQALDTLRDILTRLIPIAAGKRSMPCDCLSGAAG